MSLSAQKQSVESFYKKISTYVGADKDIKVNVRVVEAATNKDLKKKLKEGRFREDLS